MKLIALTTPHYGRIDKEDMNKPKQKTKEEIIRHDSVLERTIGDLHVADELRRKEFARAFGWFETPYNFTTKPSDPTWTQIFVELGKLLAARNFMDIEGNLSELECKLEDLEKNIRSEIYPNLPKSGNI